MARPARDLSGRRFGRLLVTSRGENLNEKPAWHCVCDCGAKRLVRAAVLCRGDAKSCGCIARERAQSNTAATKRRLEERHAAAVLLSEQGVKRCSKCGVLKSLSLFYPHKLCKNGVGACKDCCRAKSRDRARNDPAGNVRKATEWKKANPEKARAWNRSTSYKASHQRTYERGRDSLADWYIKSLFWRECLPANEIPQPLINLKRQHLRLVRLVKERTK